MHCAAEECQPPANDKAKRPLDAATGSAAMTFDQGYICAVATLLRQHGAESMAEELLRCVSPDWSTIDDYDKEALAEHGLLPNVTALAREPVRGD
jgi:hypothetical protein